MAAKQVQQLLISGFVRFIDNNSKLIVPPEIINIIFGYFYISFDFNMIKEHYGTKDIIEIETRYKSNNIGIINLPNDDDDILGIVISLNSGSITVGWAGADKPHIAIPNIIAGDNENNILIGHELKNTKYGIALMVIVPLKME